MSGVFFYGTYAALNGLQMNLLTQCRTIPMTYSVFLMVIALYKAAKIWKEVAGTKGTELIKVLLLDQAIYFGG